MTNPYLGMISIFPYNFAPLGWLDCDGSLLSIAQYDALFTLIGTTYGGDGQSTFALPDLRGRVMVGQGTFGGFTTKVIGELAGTEQVTLLAANIPSHAHVLYGTTDAGDTWAPAGAYWANTFAVDKEYKLAPTTKITMGTNMVGNNNGSSMPFGIVQPILGLRYCMATEGIYPARN